MEIRVLKSGDSPNYLDIMRGDADHKRLGSLLEQLASNFPGAKEPVLVILDGQRYQMTAHYGGTFQAKLPETAEGISKRLVAYMGGKTPEGLKLTHQPSAIVDFSNDSKVEEAYRLLEGQGHSVVMKRV